MNSVKNIALGLVLPCIASTLHATEWRKHIIQPPVKGGINGVSANDFDRDGRMAASPNT